jgi:hypothetical protein
MEMKSLSRKERSNKIASGHYIHPKREINRTSRNVPGVVFKLAASVPRSERAGKLLFDKAYKLRQEMAC